MPNTYRNFPYTVKRTELMSQICNLECNHHESPTSLNTRMLPMLVLLDQRFGYWTALQDLVSRGLLTPAEYTDGLKTARWGLAEALAPQSGIWRLTGRGQRFLKLEEPAPRRVVTYQNEVVRYDGPLVMASKLPKLPSPYHGYIADIRASIPGDLPLGDRWTRKRKRR